MPFLDLDVARARPHAVTARQLARRQVFALAERDHVETVVAGADRVLLVQIPVDDAVAGTNLVRVVVEQRQSGTGEDIEDLLRLTVDVGRRRLLAGCELDPARAGARGPGGHAEIGPGAGHLASLVAPLLDLVQVRDTHAGTLGHGLGKSRVAVVYRLPRTFVSFQLRPGLGLVDEAAQLLEQDAGGCALA